MTRFHKSDAETPQQCAVAAAHMRRLMRRTDASLRFTRHAAHAFTKALEPGTPCNHANKSASRHAPPARSSPRQPYRSASRHANFARNPADVIGFVSQFFSSTSGALGSTSTLGRPSSCADGRVGAQHYLPRGKAHGWIPPGSVLHDSSHSPGERPWLTGATGQERQPVPGAASLASHRNFINRSRSVLNYRGVRSLAA